jgi:hypothetical protein
MLTQHPAGDRDSGDEPVPELADQERCHEPSCAVLPRRPIEAFMNSPSSVTPSITHRVCLRLTCRRAAWELAGESLDGADLLNHGGEGA